MHAQYGDHAAVWHEVVLPWSIRHPESRFSVSWDLLQLFLLSKVREFLNAL